MTDNFQTIFISGANRGIGYELARQLSQQSYQIIAGYRDDSRSKMFLNEAQKTNNVFPAKVDVTSEHDLKELYDFIANQFGSLDVLVNNAGINLNRSLRMNELEWSDLEHHFKVNVGGPFLATRYLYRLLKAGKRKIIINISSNLGSTELNGGGSIPYSLSKAGLNMLSKHQALEYETEGMTVISLSPGWVRTDMGGSAAPLSVAESATRIIRIMDTFPVSRSGQFIDLNGELLPY